MRNILLTILLLVSPAFARSITLHWDASKTPGVTYRIYRGTSSGTETFLVDGIQGLTYTDPTGPEVDTYYYATAVKTNGRESIHSNEAVKPAIPGQVKNLKTKVD